MKKLFLGRFSSIQFLLYTFERCPHTKNALKTKVSSFLCGFPTNTPAQLGCLEIQHLSSRIGCTSSYHPPFPTHKGVMCIVFSNILPGPTIISCSTKIFSTPNAVIFTYCCPLELKQMHTLSAVEMTQSVKCSRHSHEDLNSDSGPICAASFQGPGTSSPALPVITLLSLMPLTCSWRHSPDCSCCLFLTQPI